MIQLIHNPRCSKSRQAKDYLESKGVDFETRLYLKEPLSEKELKEILQKLDLKPIELIRTNEAIWKENYKDKDPTDKQLIELMIKEPKLMERPIIINGDKAVVGRPTEKIEEVL